MTDPQHTIDEYIHGISLVDEAFSGMTRKELLTRPVSGRWSSMEVLCHLVDVDLTLASRIRVALKSPSPRLTATDFAEATSHLAVEWRDLTEELTLFALVRSQTARVLRVQPIELLNKPISLYGPNGQEMTRSLLRLVAGVTAHALHHLRHVHDKRRLLGLTARAAGTTDGPQLART